MISQAKEKLLSLVVRKFAQSQRYLPKKIYPDDVFVVSYPRSGNTWVRFLIANLLKPPGTEINFHTVHEYVPEVGRQEELISKLSHPRIMKSHARYRPEYPKVIYLVRDGRDVYVSFYHYKLNELVTETTFADFLESRAVLSCTWAEHVSSWATETSRSSQLLVRYEDLHRNTAGEVRRMANFIGLAVSNEQIKKAVQASSFQNMQQLEIMKGRPFKSGDDPALFTRKGQPNNWEDYFTDEAKQIFKSREGHVLIELGYELHHDW